MSSIDLSDPVKTATAYGQWTPNTILPKMKMLISRHQTGTNKKKRKGRGGG
jgi:hypothetical protein